MTRQWLADPNEMCIKHIGAEHFETHIFLTKMEKGYSLQGFIDGSMFFGAPFIKERHDLLAEFLDEHATPLYIPAVGYGSIMEKYPEVPRMQSDFDSSLGTLYERCANCRKQRDLWHGNRQHFTVGETYDRTCDLSELIAYMQGVLGKSDFVIKILFGDERDCDLGAHEYVQDLRDQFYLCKKHFKTMLESEYAK